MKLALYQVDAFATELFAGNPAAVCPLDAWLPESLMQSIAAENNLSETAFFVPVATGFHIRWFTPTTEVNLCGHATLAAAHVLFHELAYERKTILFASRSGQLQVSRQGALLSMDFPASPPLACITPQAITQALPMSSLQGCLKAEDYIVLLAYEDDVRTAQPDLSLLAQLDGRGVMITAPSQAYDFVARFFAPRCGIDEDPVTGSAYTQLAPYWAARLGRQRLRARQLSARGGDVLCTLHGDRVRIAGHAMTYLRGDISVQCL